jgi:hypothetical protein
MNMRTSHEIVALPMREAVAKMQASAMDLQVACLGIEDKAAQRHALQAQLSAIALQRTAIEAAAIAEGLVSPEHAERQKSEGDALLESGDTLGAIQRYRTSLAARPDFAAAEHNLTIALLQNYDETEAGARLECLLERERGLSAGKRERFVDDGSDTGEMIAVSPFKLMDTSEQIRHLVNSKKIDASFGELACRYEELLNDLAKRKNRAPYTQLTESERRRFSGYLDKCIYRGAGAALDEPVINPDLDFRAIEEEYNATKMLYFEALLTAPGISALRTYLRDSTIFFKHSEARFVGSYLMDGLACGLVFQLLREIRACLPRILRDRPVNNMWAYRYDAAGSGVVPHNGDGSVTLNFWLTPDDCNLTSGAGGMVMYDKTHPPEWNWQVTNQYKDDTGVQERVAAHLRDAKETVIPYRENRGVLFHSTLFHKTDPFRFKDGFPSRRANITILFGRRNQEAAALQ